MFIQGGEWHLFILIPQLYSQELRTKNPGEKDFSPRNIHQKKFQTDEILTTKTFKPTKLPTKKILDARWHDDARSTRSTMAQDPWNLAHLFLGTSEVIYMFA